MEVDASSLALWTAEWVYPGFGAPIPRGVVAIQDGVVVAVGERAHLHHAWPLVPLRNKGAALTPRPVNAHTHLDLTLCPPFRGTYPEFVRHVVSHRSCRGRLAAREGLQCLRALGIGAFGDIIADAEAMEELLEAEGPPGVLYWEVVAPDPSRAPDKFRELRDRFELWRKRAGCRRLGISPHAAHTVSAPLFRLIGEYARGEGIPLQIHVAESPAEAEYFRQGTGPLRQLLRELTGLTGECPGLSPVAYLAELGVLGASTNLIHAVQADAADVRLLRDHGATVVACPRSNAALAVGSFPWRLFAEAGVPVALGTDSVVTGQDLDVTRELPDLLDRVPPGVLLPALTRNGYLALGLPPALLQPGTPVGAVGVMGGGLG